MINSLYNDEAPASIHLWFLALVLPMLLAAGVLDRSGKDTVLPSEESYRSNFSDTILDTSTWRKPEPPDIQWREPTRPSLGWRTPPRTESPSTTTRRRIELFPKYQPGRNSDFDYITREEKPLIKVFEFGR